MEKYDSRPTAIDLFCGVGGLSLGLIQAGFQLKGGVHSNAGALNAFRVNFPGIATSSSDLFEVSGKNLKAELGFDNVNLVVGGPPCQGFSFGGLQDDRDGRNQGVLAFARLIGELKPRFFVMENVRGFLSKRHDGIRERFFHALSQQGYCVRTPISVLNAADFGVPQRRLRAFVLGARSGETLPEYPKPKNRRGTTVRAAIGDLCRLDRDHTDQETDMYIGKLGQPSKYAERLRLKKRSKVVRITGCQRSEHSPDVVERFRTTLPGDQEKISRYYRLAWNGVSPTIRAGTGPEHGSHTAPRPIHPEYPRCITVREAARLHSFPDWFEFQGTRWHGFRQIGNSVPPMLARQFS